MNCFFKHIILEYSSNDDEESDDDENDSENVDDINSEGNSDIVRKEKKTKNKGKNDSNTVDVIVEVHDQEKDVVDTIDVAGTIEALDLKVYVSCRDPWLHKNQTYYTDDLRKFSEIENIENL